MRILPAVCLAAALPLLAQHEKEGEKNKAIGDLQAIEAGRKLFANGCAACHGPMDEGAAGPTFASMSSGIRWMMKRSIRRLPRGSRAECRPPTCLRIRPGKWSRS